MPVRCPLDAARSARHSPASVTPGVQGVKWGALCNPCVSHHSVGGQHHRRREAFIDTTMLWKMRGDRRWWMNSMALSTCQRRWSP